MTRFTINTGGRRVGKTLLMKLALQAEDGAPSIPLGLLPPGTYSAKVLSVRYHDAALMRGWKRSWIHRKRPAWRHFMPNRSQWARMHGL